MVRSYVIQKGDTLGKIAKNFYGDRSLYTMLADFNGIRDPNLIDINQVIEIPSKDELLGTVLQPIVQPQQDLVTPNGLNEIVTTFGNIYDYIRADGALEPRWEMEHLSSTPLPFAIPLSWDLAHSVSNLCCHRKLAGLFSRLFTTIQTKGLQSKIRTFGGCYNYRPKRSSNKLSRHSWGIAIDLNPDTNPQGSSGDMDPGVVEVFQSFGFKWGGDWSGKSKDPMHFQFCTGY